MSNATLPRSHSDLTGHGLSLGRLLNTVLRLPLMVLDLMIDWQQGAEDRATMTSLSSDQLRDIGLTREELAEMAGKTSWSRRD